MPERDVENMITVCYQRGLSETGIVYYNLAENLFITDFFRQRTAQLLA